MEEFVKKTIKEHEKELEEIKKLQEIIDQLDINRKPQIYSISITSNY